MASCPILHLVRRFWRTKPPFSPRMGNMFIMIHDTLAGQIPDVPVLSSVVSLYPPVPVAAEVRWPLDATFSADLMASVSMGCPWVMAGL